MMKKKDLKNEKTLNKNKEKKSNLQKIKERRSVYAEEI